MAELIRDSGGESCRKGPLRLADMVADRKMPDAETRPGADGSDSRSQAHCTYQDVAVDVGAAVGMGRSIPEPCLCACGGGATRWRRRGMNRREGCISAH
jgi:hypothetical protein